MHNAAIEVQTNVECVFGLEVGLSPVFDHV